MKSAGSITCGSKQQTTLMLIQTKTLLPQGCMHPCLLACLNGMFYFVSMSLLVGDYNCLQLRFTACHASALALPCSPKPFNHLWALADFGLQCRCLAPPTDYASMPRSQTWYVLSSEINKCVNYEFFLSFLSSNLVLFLSLLLVEVPMDFPSQKRSYLSERQNLL